ncbi:MAG: hypothetical protein FJW39_13775 [Acidobacteria bacterium]|nr:hypothetical protein [Acidobacteriota bacterium]
MIRWRPALAIFVLALSVRAPAALWGTKHETFGRGEVENVAVALCQDSAFARVWRQAGGPTAHVAPIYPLILSAVPCSFGVTPEASAAASVLACVLMALQFSLFPWVACALGLPRRLGIIGGILGAALPIQFWAQTSGSWEAPLAGVLLIVSMGTGVRIWQRSFGWWHAAGAGLLWGLASLTMPTLLPFLISLGLIGAWRQPAMIARFAVLAGCWVSVLFPWAVRNRLELGEWIWTRSNFGMELALANHEYALADGDGEIAITSSHPYHDLDERSKILEMGEAAYNRQKMEQALAWMRTNPGVFTELAARRVALFWFPELRWQVQTGAVQVVTVLGFAGLLLWWIRMGGDGPRMAGLLLVLFPLPYYLVLPLARYRTPVEWLLFLLCAIVVAPRTAPGPQSRHAP